MVLTNNTHLTDSEIIEKANKAIIKELGVSGYMRYLRLRQTNNIGKDYVKEQQEMFNDITVEELSDEARKYREETKL